MPDRVKMQKMRTAAIQSGQRRIQLSGFVRKLAKQRWLRVSPIFFLGTIITATGTTLLESDMIIFAGMVIMGLGVVAMWIAETGRFSIKYLPAPLVFMAGTVITAMSMTVVPSNPLLCGGMILTGLGTIVMWLIYVGKWNTGAAIVALLFTAGIVIEALGLTIIPSDLMIMIGMIATGIGAFAMWSFELVLDTEEEEQAPE